MVTVCLIATGMLIGWVASSAFGANSWNALSAIGGWVGGLGAFYAAYVAIKIAREQAERDTYKLYIEAYDVQGTEYITSSDSSGNIVNGRPMGHLKIKVYNSGLRPIELVKLIFIHEFGQGYIPITCCFVEAGKQNEWEYKDDIYFTYHNRIIPIDSNRLLDGDIEIMDAAGAYHKVHKVE